LTELPTIEYFLEKDIDEEDLVQVESL